LFSKNIINIPFLLAKGLACRVSLLLHGLFFYRLLLLLYGYFLECASYFFFGDLIGQGYEMTEMTV
jgi:hypothetical protein